MLFHQPDRKMESYRFFSKADPTQETYKTVRASSRIEAVEYFAKMKDLSVEKFLKVYDVSEVE